MPGLTVAAPKPAVLQPSEEEKQLVQGYQRETQELQTRVEPIKREMGALEGQMRSITEQPVQQPKLQDVPQFQARQVDQGEMLTFASIAMVMAALGTKAVRGDTALAFNTAGAAINGFHEGNIAQAKLDIENFNTKMRGVIAQNKTMLEAYDAVLADRKLTMAQKLQQYRVLASKYDDEIAMSAVKKGDLKLLLDRAEKLRGANQQAEFVHARLQTTLTAMMARAQMQRDRASNPGPVGDTPLSPQAVDMYAKAWIKDKNAVAGLGRGVQGARDLRAIANRAAEIIAASGGKDLTQTRAEIRADANSLNKLTMSYDAITAFEQTAVRNGHVLVDLAAKVDVTGMPVIERWIRAGRQAIAGDPDVSLFHAQMQVYRTEAARILVNPNLTGQLTDSARKEVEAFLSSNDSAEQITRVVALLERDFENRKGTLEKQMDAIRDRMQKGYGAGTAPAAPGEEQRSTSKSGRPIISRDGGKTWEYAD